MTKEEKIKQEFEELEKAVGDFVKKSPEFEGDWLLARKIATAMTNIELTVFIQLESTTN